MLDFWQMLELRSWQELLAHMLVNLDSHILPAFHQSPHLQLLDRGYLTWLQAMAGLQLYCSLTPTKRMRPQVNGPLKLEEA